MFLLRIVLLSISAWPDRAANRYAGVGYLAIDNNAAEWGFRPIGIGRRNWLFAGSDAGGRTATKSSTTALLFSAQHRYIAS